MTALNPPDHHAPRAEPPAWSDADLSDNPHLDHHKPDKVRAMFAAIARSYDLNNRLHSLYLDVLWRKFAVRFANLELDDHVLDVACGTGDLALQFARAKPAPARVVGLDFTAPMLEIAQVKLADANLAAPIVEFLHGDAQALPFSDASFNVVSIAFGIRNVHDPALALREFRRVLRPGGRLVILEFAQPAFAPVRWFNNLYCKRIMPVTATLIARDRSGAYKYLPRSVESFMEPADLKSLMVQSGFIDPIDRPLSVGICRCYRALVPG